jgi:hypothetical protein
MKPEWERIVAQKQEAKEASQKSRIIRNCGYNPEDPEECERAFMICRPYLPAKSQRNMSYSQWLKHIGIIEGHDKQLVTAPAMNNPAQHERHPEL